MNHLLQNEPACPLQKHRETTLQLELEIENEASQQLLATARFVIGDDRRVREFDSAASALLGIRKGESPRIEECSSLESARQSLSREAERICRQEDDRPAYLRIELKAPGSETAAAFCATLQPCLHHGAQSCHCTLERIGPGPEALSCRDTKAKALESTGVILWSMDPAAQRFQLSVSLNNLLDNTSGQSQCSLDDWIELVDREDRAETRDAFQRLLEGAVRTIHIRYRIKSANGERRNISTIAKRMPSARNPDEIEIVGLHRNENEIRNAQSELRLFSFLAKKIHTPALITDAYGRVTWFNQAFQTLSGYPLEELVGEKPGHFLQGQLTQSSEIELMRERIRKRKAFHVELINYHKNGTPYWVRIDANPLVNDKGDTTHFIAFETDITDSKKTKDSISQNEAKYRSLFNNSVDALVLASAKDGVIIETNAAAAKLLSNERLLGRNVHALIGEDLNGQTNWLAGLLDGQESSAHLSTAIDHGKGILAPVEITATLLPLGEGHGLLLSLRDVSEKKLLEEQLRHSQKMEAVGRLAGGIAHDFNNLLAGMRGFAELLTHSTVLSRQDQSYVIELLKIADRARSMTSRLLSFSRGQRNEQVVTNLNQIVKSFMPMLKRLVPSEVAFRADTKLNLPNTRLDIGQIEQVILNLVVNAQEALVNASPSIILRTGQAHLTGRETFINGKPKPGPYAYLEVQDNGSGIDTETVKKIFEPFFTTKHGAGTGLGLSIVYGIVNNNHGFLNVSSEAGQGTSFKIFFPTVREELPPESTEDFNVRRCINQAKVKATILLAEDQTQVREILELGIKQSGYNLIVAKDGREAINLAKSHDGVIDLLLSDAIMPKMSGPELVSAVRQLHPEVKAMIMSGLPKSEVLDELETPIEIDVFIEKPFSIVKLMDQITALIERPTLAKR